MFRKAFAGSSPYVFGQSVPGKPQSRPLFPQHTNFSYSPYFPQHSNFSGTCDSNKDPNHGFHFHSNWRRNGEKIKTTVSHFSNICYWVFSTSRSRRRRQRLWFVQFAKFAATTRRSWCHALKSCRTRKCSLGFHFQTSWCCCIPHRIYISAFLHVLSATITSQYSYQFR